MFEQRLLSLRHASVHMDFFTEKEMVEKILRILQHYDIFGKGLKK